MSLHAVPPTRLEDPSTWIKFTPKLCKNCNGSCCKLPVEVTIIDLVRMGYADEFEMDENPKKIAKRLKKAGIIEHFYPKKELFTLTRLANGDCLFLDTRNRLCTIYQDRPDTCRNHPRIGPRSGYCAYNS